MPSRKSIEDTAIQWLSAVLASVEDAAFTRALGFEGFETVILLTAVLETQMASTSDIACTKKATLPLRKRCL